MILKSENGPNLRGLQGKQVFRKLSQNQVQQHISQLGYTCELVIKFEKIKILLKYEVSESWIKCSYFGKGLMFSVI